MIGMILITRKFQSIITLPFVWTLFLTTLDIMPCMQLRPLDLNQDYFGGKYWSPQVEYLIRETIDFPQSGCSPRILQLCLFFFFHRESNRTVW